MLPNSKQESGQISYRLTVAGEALAKSCTSKTMCMYGVYLIRSLFAKHNLSRREEQHEWWLRRKSCNWHFVVVEYGVQIFNPHSIDRTYADQRLEHGIESTCSYWPSQIIQWWSFDWSWTHCRTLLPISPSFHSMVVLLNSPYSSPAVIDLGLRTYVWTGW